MRSSRAADSSRRTRSSSRTSTSEALAQLFDSRSGHTMRHERERLLGELVADDNRLRQGIEPGAHAIRILRKDGRDRLTFQHLVARLHRDDESHGVIDRVLDGAAAAAPSRDRKSTRLNSSHLVISYAVFCLKKKKHKSTTDKTINIDQAM